VIEERPGSDRVRVAREDTRLSLLREDIERGARRSALQQYSEVAEETLGEDLQSVLEGTPVGHGVPKVPITDGGLPYHSHDFGKSARRTGFRHRTVTPGDSQANGFAEASAKVRAKLIQTAAAEGRDPRKASSRYLLIYRAAPHRMMRKSPAEPPMGGRYRHEADTRRRGESGRSTLTGRTGPQRRTSSPGTRPGIHKRGQAPRCRGIPNLMW